MHCLKSLVAFLFLTLTACGDSAPEAVFLLEIQMSSSETEIEAAYQSALDSLNKSCSQDTDCELHHYGACNLTASNESAISRAAEIKEVRDQRYQVLALETPDSRVICAARVWSVECQQNLCTAISQGVDL